MDYKIFIMYKINLASEPQQSNKCFPDYLTTIANRALLAAHVVSCKLSNYMFVYNIYYSWYLYKYY